MSVSGPSDIVTAIRHHAKRTPDATAFRFVGELGTAREDLSFRELDELARKVASRLLEHTAAGDRVVLALPDPARFVPAFFACLYAGLVPVPSPVPAPRRGDDRMIAIASSCAPAAVLFHGRPLAVFARRLTDALGSNRPTPIDIDSLGDGDPDRGPIAIPAPDDLALIQYTSGSTSAPRGVMITHGNLVSNCHAMARGFGFDARSLAPVGWVPLFHDMGLVGHVVLPAFFGATSVLMPTVDFLQRPDRWLRLIDESRGTLSLAPNFAYDLCVDRVGEETKRGLDLSSWRFAVNGAEPVRKRTLERFAAAFARCGFTSDAFFPGYGLAECALYVSGGPRRPFARFFRADRAALALGRAVEARDDDSAPIHIASCGRPRFDCAVRIADPATGRPSADLEVGEILVSGPAVAAGYFGDPRATAATFGAMVPGDAGSFLRTGDLGFTLNGELYPCGRQKDLIIINGANHHPQDLELTVETCHPALRPGGAAAFGIDLAEREVLVVVCEVRRSALASASRGAIVEDIRRALFEAHGVGLHEAMLVPSGSIPRTSSKKPIRHACKEAYLEGRLSPIGEPD